MVSWGRSVLISFANDKTFGFSVKDNGIGISEEEQKEIFNTFYHTPKSNEMGKNRHRIGIKSGQEN